MNAAHLFVQQNSRCFFCGHCISQDDGNMEHLSPRCDDGPNAEHNLVFCCKAMNSFLGCTPLKLKIRFLMAVAAQYANSRIPCCGKWTESDAVFMKTALDILRRAYPDEERSPRASAVNSPAVKAATKHQKAAITQDRFKKAVAVLNLRELTFTPYEPHQIRIDRQGKPPAFYHCKTDSWFNPVSKREEQGGLVSLLAFLGK